MKRAPRHDLRASQTNIDVWLAFYHDIRDRQLHDEYRALLSQEERAREFRFYFADDQKRYLVTRAMVRIVLSRYVAIDPAEWRFSNNRYGRPQIANFGSDDCGLRFNISHTRGLIALGVAHNRALGVDVENVSAREASMEIADRFFAKAEVDELARVGPERQQDRFFEYWTFKEAYIKARGMGLSLPLKEFAFHYPHERAVRIVIQPHVGDDANRWCFWQFRLDSAYLFALCAERRRGVAPWLTFRRTVPLVGEHILQPQLLKTSEVQTAMEPAG